MDKELVGTSIKKLSTSERRGDSGSAGEWIKIERKRKHTPPITNVIVVRPFKHFWCGFNSAGREKWFIELTNGRVVSGNDENYHYWLKKYQNTGCSK